MRTLSAEDLRAALARDQIKKFHVAAQLDMHPSRFGRLCLGQDPISPEMAVKISEAMATVKKAQAVVP